MGLFTFNINYVVDEETKNDIRDIKKTQEKIMATVQELTELVQGLEVTVGELQVSTDTLQEKITNAIATLNATIVDLTSQLANGATPAEVSALVDTLTTMKNNLEVTKADLDATEV